LSTCKYCVTRKTIRKPFGKGSGAEFLLQLIYSDIFDLMNVRPRYRSVYFITFIYISEALSYFIKYMNLIENQLDMKIKILKTD